MKPRSPVLGYNHNVRYANRLWHVQTEDSGVQNPHIFTHLFHNGTILATKRLDYDPASEVAAVQKLMQTQHKAMLRELKAGAYDEKIGKYFGEPVVREAAASSDDSGEISGAIPVATSATPAPAAPPPAVAAPPPPAAMLDDEGTVFDPYVPTAMREERASRGDRVTADRMPVAAAPVPTAASASPAGSDTAIERVRADMGSAPTMLAMPGAAGEEGPRFRDTLSTPAPTTAKPPASPSTAPRVPTPASGVRARVPTPVGNAAPRSPTPVPNAKPSSALPSARPSSQTDNAPPQLTPTARPPSQPGARPSTPAGAGAASPAKPPSQPSVTPPARPSTQPQISRPPSQPSVTPPARPSTQPQITKPPSQPSVARPPSQPSVARPPSQPGVSRPPSQPQLARPPVAGTTRPAPGRPVTPTPARPGVPPSTVPATGARPPAQTGSLGERRRSPSQPAFSKPTAEGVVVARPAVIIGGESSRATAARPSAGSSARWSGDPQPVDPAARPSSDNIFGGDLISEKSLDEVILAYLSEDLNEK